MRCRVEALSPIPGNRYLVLVILAFIALAWLLLIVVAVILCLAAQRADGPARGDVARDLDVDRVLVPLHRSAAAPF